MLMAARNSPTSRCNPTMTVGVSESLRASSKNTPAGSALRRAKDRGALSGATPPKRHDHQPAAHGEECQGRWLRDRGDRQGVGGEMDHRAGGQLDVEVAAAVERMRAEVRREI